MESPFVPLTCPNCGGKLEVYSDIDRFACGHCGTEMLVQRRGGTVALKAVTEAIRKVQAGTDKTAAELALVRLERELEVSRREHAKAAAVVDATRPVFGTGFIGKVLHTILLLGKECDQNALRRMRQMEAQIAHLQRQITEKRRIANS